MSEIIFSTGSGFWSPLMLVAGSIITIAIVYIIRSKGSNKRKNSGEQSMSFFSGNIHPDEEIGSENLYWGFFKSLEGYYEFMRKMHSGIINDYVFWLVLLAVVMLAAMAFGGIL